MEMKLFLSVTEKEEREALYDLLVLGEKEFVPPLSSRSSTTQQSLANAEGNGIDSYFEEMIRQSFVLAVEDGKYVGFMSFRTEYENPHLPKGEKLYASTCVVHPEYRGRGMMTSFYKTMIEAFPERPIFTRTWHENFGHLRVLEKLGFTLLETLENDRGEGIHTVYYGREARKA